MRIKDSKLVEECECCGFGPTMATPINNPVREHTDQAPYWVCNVCSSTHAGNALLYPTNADYAENGAVLRTIAHATNMILAAIEGRR